MQFQLIHCFLNTRSAFEIFSIKSHIWFEMRSSRIWVAFIIYYHILWQRLENNDPAFVCATTDFPNLSLSKIATSCYEGKYAYKIHVTIVKKLIRERKILTRSARVTSASVKPKPTCRHKGGPMSGCALSTGLSVCRPSVRGRSVLDPISRGGSTIGQWGGDGSWRVIFIFSNVQKFI